MLILLAKALLLWFFFNCKACASKHAQEAANLPAAEITALHEFYNSTQGWNWLWRPVGAHWEFNATANPCSDQWQGIICVLPAPQTFYYVVEIALSQYGLIGSLPASIGVFGHLTLLDVSRNAVNGSIPASMAELTSLQSLSLSNSNLTGGLTEPLCQLRNLTGLSADATMLGGSIPSCFGQLRLLQNLTLSASELTGTIPAALGNMSSLQVLNLSSNSLVGTIPSAIGKLLSLQQLRLYENQLSGTIAQEVVQLPSLQYLDLSSNKFIGRIPAFNNNASRMRVLLLQYNMLTGTLPASIERLSGLTELVLNNNLLTGELPESLGDLYALYELELSYNSFSGQIPVSLARLGGLAYMDLRNNGLTGAIPNELGNLTKLQFFSCYENILTGTIPVSLGALQDVQYFDLGFNSLTGALPGTLANMEAVRGFFVDRNVLTGPVPVNFKELKLITTFDVRANYLTGLLSKSIGNWLLCKFIQVYTNLFDGTLPDAIGAMGALVELRAYENMLTGPLPKSLSNLSVLNALVVDNNRFNGGLSGVFNASVQGVLQTILLHDNQLTNTLPAEVFQLPALQTFVALSNCFHGTIPEDVCNATALSSLVLDGLSSATSCRRSLPSGAYLLSFSVGGTLPLCLFQLLNLQTLHLSGNVFTGSLPSLEAADFDITDLTVSHNQLSGTIPAVYQLRRWSNLDLSYNRLSGTLVTNFGTVGAYRNASSISLENNRLSGRIPGALQQMQNVSMLGTNLFECNLAGSNLPQHDSGRSNYQCGSTGFNIPYYIWLCLVFPSALIAALWRWEHPPTKISNLVTLTRLVTSWYDSSQRVVGGRPILPSLMHMMDTLFWTSSYCALYVTVVLLPCYLLLSHYYDTLTHQYAWAVSSTFLSGAVPVAVELPLWLILLGVVAYVVHNAIPEAQHIARAARPASLSKKTLFGLSVEVRNRAVIQALFVLIDVVVVVGANLLYVYIAIYKSSALLVLAQIMLSFFKLLWSSTCMDIILRWLASKLAPELLAGDGYAKAYRTEFLSLHLFVSLLNSVSIPCLVVASISPDCFYNVFQPAPVVKSYFSYPECDSIYGGECVITTLDGDDATFDAPFTYTYQCSSSLITYYAPAYVNLCIVASFITPAAHILCGYLLKRASPNSTARVILDKLLPRILQEAPVGNGQESYLQANQLQITLVTYLGVLLTFGAMLPPLGVALAMTVAITVLLTKVKIGRFLCSAEEQGQLDKFVRILEEQCEGAVSASFLQSALWMLLTLSCLFYTLFLFDTLGDAVGFRDALWVLVVVPLIPLLFYGVYRACVQQGRKTRNKGGEVGSGSCVELGAITAGQPEIHNPMSASAF